MESERPTTSGRVGDRPVKYWEKDEDKSEIKIERPKTGISRPQTRQERPISRKGHNEMARVESAMRSSTPARNVVARPPSASAYSHRGNTANAHLTSAMGMSRISTGLPPTSHMNTGGFDRPITQHGIAGLRPSTTRGLPMNRQIQDKRYFEGLLQLKTRELSQEIVLISKDIENQKKERSTYSHYDNRARELAAELTKLQGQLADYNIIMDKVASNIDKDGIEQEIKDIKDNNERCSNEVERLYEQRKLKEEQLNDIQYKIELEEKKAERIIEDMDIINREKYDKLLDERNNLENKIGKIQREIDLLLNEKKSLEEQISMSQIKQESVKLRIKINETEDKRDKLLEEQKNKLSPDEERERLLLKVKKDNADIIAAEKRIIDTENKLKQIEQELEQLEIDLDENQSEKQVKYNELRKREEAIDQFMPTFEQNKQDEIKKLNVLEENVVEKLRELSFVVDKDNKSSTNSDELSILNQITNDNQDDNLNFEQLGKKNLELQETILRMEILEKKLKNELIELNEKNKKLQNELIVLEDLDGLKTRNELNYQDLISKRDELKLKQPDIEIKLNDIKDTYGNLKNELNKNDIYVQINHLEEKLETLQNDCVNLNDYINKTRDKINYEPLKEQTLNLVQEYNSHII